MTHDGARWRMMTPDSTRWHPMAGGQLSMKPGIAASAGGRVEGRSCWVQATVRSRCITRAGRGREAPCGKLRQGGFTGSRIHPSPLVLEAHMLRHTWVSLSPWTLYECCTSLSQGLCGRATPGQILVGSGSGRARHLIYHLK